MIGTMKKSGMDWPIIANATGIDSQKYQQMQIEYQKLQALPEKVHRQKAINMPGKAKVGRSY
jgi:hypothetical protein